MSNSMEETSMNSPISGIKSEQKRNKNKANCVEPSVNEPKRTKLEQSGPEAGSKIEQPAPQTGSELEQPTPGASLGSRLLRIDSELDVRVMKDGRNREIYMTDGDGHQIVIKCVLPRPESPKSPPDYGWAPLSPMPTDEEYGLPLEELEIDPDDLEADNDDIYTRIPQLKGIEGEQKRNKNKASCVEPSVNEPKRTKLEQSGHEAGSKIEQPGPQTGSELEQPAPGASLGSRLRRVDSNLDVNVVKDGRRRTVYMTDTDGRKLTYSCILPRPKSPEPMPDYGWEPLSPFPTDEEYGQPRVKWETDPDESKEAEVDLYTLVPKLKGWNKPLV